jgi:hypothetical protein
MNVSPLLFLARGRRGRQAKPAAPRTFLAVEALEDRTTPAAMPVGSPDIMASLGGSASMGVLQVSGQAHGSVQGSQALQTLLRQASLSLTTLSRSLTNFAVQVNNIASGNLGNLQPQFPSLLTQLQGNLTATALTLNNVAGSLSGFPAGRFSREAHLLGTTLHGFASSLGTVSVAVNVLVGSLPAFTGPGTSVIGGAPNTTTALLTNLLTRVARNAGALAGALSALARQTPATTAQQVDAVLVGVNTSLNNVAVSLNALTVTVSGATANTTGTGLVLVIGTGSTAALMLNDTLLALGSTLTTVQASLNALAGIIPVAARLPQASGQSLLRLAGTDVAANLGAVSGSLSLLAAQLTGNFAIALASVFPPGGLSGGSLGSTSQAVGTLVADTSVSLGALANSLAALGRALPGLTPAALASANNLLRSAAADVSLLAQQLVIAGQLLGLTTGFSANLGQANQAQVVEGVFVAVTRDLDLVSADLLRLANGT